jgi:hypothetical protein
MFTRLTSDFKACEPSPANSRFSDMGPFGAPRPYEPSPILLTPVLYHCIESVHPVNHKVDRKAPLHSNRTHADSNQGREEPAGGAGATTSVPLSL